MIAKTKVGELSVVPERVTLLAPCVRHLPTTTYSQDRLRDPFTRARLRHVDLLVNPESRAVFLKRSQVTVAFDKSCV